MGECKGFDDVPAKTVSKWLLVPGLNDAWDGSIIRCRPREGGDPWGLRPTSLTMDPRFRGDDRFWVDGRDVFYQPM